MSVKVPDGSAVIREEVPLTVNVGNIYLNKMDVPSPSQYVQAIHLGVATFSGPIYSIIEFWMIDYTALESG